MDYSLTIYPGAATEDARDIENIVATIESCLDTLNDLIKKHIPENLETDWSKDLLESWTKAYNESIETIIHEMTLSAKNLEMAVEQALAYSKNGQN